MLYSCGVNFSTASYPRCNANITGVDVNNPPVGNYVSCSVPFELGVSDLITCPGTAQAEQNIEDFEGTHYLFLSDSAIPFNTWIKSQSGFDNILVSDVLYSGSGSDGSSLSPEDYSALVSLGILPLVIAWSFRMILRMILNR